MIISIQVPSPAKKFEHWDDVKAVLHQVKDREEACTIAYAISKQVGSITHPGSPVTVRMVEVPKDVLGELENHGDKLQDYVGRLSGAYIQSK